jgi:release factor glutamine methyltransferase
LTVGDALDAFAGRFKKAGIDTPELDAELLVRHVLGWDRAKLITQARESLGPVATAEIFRLVEARAARHPLQHLTGTQAFWRHEFLVTGDVLIPRPETEILVEEALLAVRHTQAPVIVDVGTGSGCIALSLAAERPDAIVHAVDVSRAALVVARENARRLGLVQAVRFHEGDLLTPWAGQGEAFHLVASNPPYVAAEEIAALAPEVRDHEPRQALVPPGSALSMYERLCPEAAALLFAGGHLVMEVGAGQAEAVSAFANAAGLHVVRVSPDLQGIPRTVVARKPGG